MPGTTIECASKFLVTAEGSKSEKANIEKKQVEESTVHGRSAGGGASHSSVRKAIS